VPDPQEPYVRPAGAPRLQGSRGRFPAVLADRFSTFVRSADRRQAHPRRRPSRSYQSAFSELSQRRSSSGSLCAPRALMHLYNRLGAQRTASCSFGGLGRDGAIKDTNRGQAGAQLIKISPPRGVVPHVMYQYRAREHSTSTGNRLDFAFEGSTSVCDVVCQADPGQEVYPHPAGHGSRWRTHISHVCRPDEGSAARSAPRSIVLSLHPTPLPRSPCFAALLSRRHFRPPKTLSRHLFRHGEAARLRRHEPGAFSNLFARASLPGIDGQGHRRVVAPRRVTAP